MVVGQWGFVQGSDKWFMHQVREREREREVGGGLPIDNDQVEDKGGGNGRRSDDDRWEGAFTPLTRCKTIYAL